jgi:hypothetical protein
LFNRLIPQSVKDYVDKSYDTLPNESMKPQLEFYLKERITPLLDSGWASRVNWDAEMLPHKVDFKISPGWVPSGKVPTTGSNSVEG